MAVYDYDVDYAPPAPVCQIYLGPGGDEANYGPYKALIDTGADISILPMDYLRQIGAPQVGRDRARSVWGDARSVGVYAVSFKLEGLHIRALRVLADEQGDEIVLGRTVLNRLRIVLDGWASVTDILWLNKAPK